MKKRIFSDLTIVGGGIAGITAALAAARLGIKAALVNDRPVLGGNSSSEFRVWISGAQTGFNRYARETGIIEELLMENHYKNPEGNPHIWDAILLDRVTAEPNIDLYLNTYIDHVTMDGRKIESVSGFQMRSHQQLEFVSPLFLDSSGDGAVAFLAGAEYRVGQESRAEFGESLAPVKANPFTMGNTIFFYTKDLGRPVKFHSPSFAAQQEEMKFLTDRFRGPFIDERANGCDYWWFEYGGVRDTIADDALITRHIQRIVWGIWDYIKNSGKFQADNLTLEWIGSIPGKRESRRFIGDYILKQQDIEQSVRFPDAVAYGGWPIDLHPPEGIDSSEPPCCQVPIGIYDVPYRTLYSKDVDNLFLAGRNHSATRIAFSSTRVMATCGVMGQAVGTAAVLARKYDCSPREVGRYMHELQQLLLKEDAYIIGVPSRDEQDLARTAVIAASSERIMENAQAEEFIPLSRDCALILPVEHVLDRAEFLFDAVVPSHLVVEVFSTARPELYLPGEKLAEHVIRIPSSGPRWHSIDLPAEVPEGRKIWVMFRANPDVKIGCSNASMTGVLSMEANGVERQHVPGTITAPYVLMRPSICFRTAPVQRYTAAYVANGIARPYGLPNLWSSALMHGKPEWLEIRFAEPKTVQEVRLTFNTDLNQRFINLRAVDSNVFPETVKDYDVQVKQGAEYATVAAQRGNYQRRQIHRFPPVTTEAVRIMIYETNGSPFAEIFEVRVY